MINYILLAIFISLQCGDFYTTYAIIKSGKGHEANPILAALFGEVGYVAGLVLVKAAAIGAGVFLMPYGYALAGLNVLYLWVVCSNYAVLKDQK